MADLSTHQEVIVKVGEAITVCTSLGACVMDYLDHHAAAVGVLIAGVSLVTTISINWYWRVKMYKLEVTRRRSN
jgi:hypothetical protein